MGFKQEDGTLKDDCLDKIKPGEPFFILRGQDILAPDKVRDWAREASVNGCSHSKVREAFATADAMEKWPNRKYPD